MYTYENIDVCIKDVIINTHICKNKEQIIFVSESTRQVVHS